MSVNKQKMSEVKQAIITAVCIALCVALPLAFHGIPQAGMIYCPMHIPVLICGLVCDFPFALICGLMGPVFSSLITAMPDAAHLPGMIVELAVYAVVSSLMMRCVHTKRSYADLYISLLTAMVIGRVAAGIVKALFFARGNITIVTWAAAHFVTCLPGIAIQIVFIPIIYFALEKANLIPSRYITDEV